MNAFKFSFHLKQVKVKIILSNCIIKIYKNRYKMFNNFGNYNKKIYYITSDLVVTEDEERNYALNITEK